MSNTPLRCIILNKMFLAASSAMPEKIKRETIVNEMLRRLSNISLGHPDTRDNTVVAINEYMATMKRSGYSEKTRRETAIAGFKGMETKIREASEEDKPLHRHKEDGARERFKRKVSLKSSWFNKRRNKPKNSAKAGNNNNNNNANRNKAKKRNNTPKNFFPNKPPAEQDSREVESVVFIPYTKGSSLRKQLQEEDDKVTKILGIPRTKYIEKAGNKISSQIIVKNPWVAIKGGCGRKLCYACKSTAGKGISCRKEGINYSITCKLCETTGRKTLYLGESSRSAYERMNEHAYLFRTKKEGDPEKQQSNSVLWGHSRDHHAGQMVMSDWKISIDSSHVTPLNRQVTEAVRISRASPDILLNSKNEFGANNLPELELRYGTRVGNGGLKRKRREEEEEEEQEQATEEPPPASSTINISTPTTNNNNITTGHSEDSGEEGSRDEVLSVVPCPPLFREDKNSHNLEGRKTLQVAQQQQQQQPPQQPSPIQQQQQQPPQPEPEKIKVEASPGVLTAEEDITRNEEDNPRPTQKLGEALSKPVSRNLSNKSKEQLQEACKVLGLPTSGNKPELRRRISERERMREAAAKYFTIQVPGVQKPAQGGFPSTPRKPKPNILPITPSSRRKREEDSVYEGSTPSKKNREEVRAVYREEENAIAREEVQPGRTEERTREAENNLLSEMIHQGSQGIDQTMRGRASNQTTKLNIVHNLSLGEDRGRPGEANEKTGGGQNRDEKQGEDLGSIQKMGGQRL